MPTLRTQNIAFGAPGIEPRWTAARKEAVGTAYSSASRIWYTIWRGILTEVYYPTVDRPQIRDLQFLVSDGESFFHEEKRRLKSTTEAIPDSLGYQITTADPDGAYKIVKTIIADPHLACILIKAKLVTEKYADKLKLYVLCSPHLGGNGHSNNGYVAEVSGQQILTANKGNTWLALGASVPFTKVSCGYVGTSDGWTDISDNYQMNWQFDCALSGNIALTAQIGAAVDEEFVLGLAFGHGAHSAITTLLQSLDTPFEGQVTRFVEQWKRTSRGKVPLGNASQDGGGLFDASYKILMAHEDKLNPGALIASLSIPWGEAKGDEDLGGYHLVWPRDMVNSATGLLAAGNRETPLRALIFLAASQRADGSFPQNFWISGDAYWQGLQMDELSFPILLAWRLRNEDALNNFDPYPMVKMAARFMVLHGPITQQERWEEVGGYSPSTLAANIASLTCASCFARARGDESTADFLIDYADFLKCHIEEWTVTTEGTLHPQIKEHFIRINPTKAADDYVHPNDAQVYIANRKPGSQNVFPAKDIVDAGFLELVRYGIFAAGDPLIVDSLKVIDHVLKFESPVGPSWRRYNHDGYGQDENGGPFISWGVGRPWPLLTGERAHYELAAGRDVKSYIKTIESFASPNGPLPEQIWDGEDLPESFLFKGKPTGSAMPLAWAHAEYIKLLRSVTDGRVFDLIPEVYERYAGGSSHCKLIEIWRQNWQVPRMKPGHILRIQADRKFKLHWSVDNWQTTNDTVSNGTALAIDYFDLEVGFHQKEPVRFTFFWMDSNTWDGKDYQVTIS
jgi:glucoamylase